MDYVLCVLYIVHSLIVDVWDLIKYTEATQYINMK